METSVQSNAAEANSVDNWNRIWDHETTTSNPWRKNAMTPVYDRIAELTATGKNRRVLDIGGGIGSLANVLSKTDCFDRVTVLDHSMAALEEAMAQGHSSVCIDVTNTPLGIGLLSSTQYDVICATEFLEHFEADTRARILHQLWTEYELHKTEIYLSVPNNRLGPEDESQHAIRWTAKQFLDLMRETFGTKNVRVEVIGGYLLAVVGARAQKSFSLSMTLPVRDEVADLGRVLASFRGVADQMVVGIDPRTTDKTRKVAEAYADVVFTLESPQGPPDAPDEWQGEDGCHFAWCRNQCIEKCDGDWIFMSEGHEYLDRGQDILLNMSGLPPELDVVFVLRYGQGQQWGFPWMFRNKPELRFVRPVHNQLQYPANTVYARMTGIRTHHDRDHGRAKVRAVQREAQNRGFERSA